MSGRKSVPKGPKSVRYFGPVIQVLKELGGSGRPAEVRDRIVSKYGIGEEERDEVLRNGSSGFANQIHRARFYLSKAGLVEASRQGVWALTDAGRNAKLEDGDALRIFYEVQSQFRRGPNGKASSEDPDVAVVTREVLTAEGQELGAWDHRQALLNTMRELSPSAFERLCRRLLLEANFQRVEVTGRWNDGGIDGHGVLQINDFVSLQVLFQCKRYANSVTPAQVREFRGAMSGRTDRGIILTTGTFTAAAQLEADRDGVHPIELVNGDRLVEMFEKLQLGLRPRTVCEVDQAFFRSLEEG